MENASHTKRLCLFCGHSEELNTTHHIVVLGPATENSNVCRPCLSSINDRTPKEWFRWLKRNDPAHWQRVVDHHRLGSSELSNLVRVIRVE